MYTSTFSNALKRAHNALELAQNPRALYSASLVVCECVSLATSLSDVRKAESLQNKMRAIRQTMRAF